MRPLKSKGEERRCVRLQGPSSLTAHTRVCHLSSELGDWQWFGKSLFMKVHLWGAAWAAPTADPQHSHPSTERICLRKRLLSAGLNWLQVGHSRECRGDSGLWCCPCTMVEAQSCHHVLLLQYLCQLCSLLAPNSRFHSKIMGKSLQHPLSWEQSFP